MPSFSRSHLSLLTAIAAALAIGWIFFRQSPPPPTADPSSPPTDPPSANLTLPPPPPLSVLADPPAWETLEKYDNTLTRNDFERILTRVFTTSDVWRDFIRIEEDHVLLHTSDFEPHETIRLSFAAETSAKPPRHWRSTRELPSFPPGKPLDGLHIAIDPGHIGGRWAKMEERWFVVGDGLPVTEGDMTLFVARLLQPRLEALGAKITLVRDKAEPVTPIRPEALAEVARDPSTDASPAALQRLAERLFYRTAEIRARGHIVNEVIRPDLVLCLHFNAEAWGDPNQPTLIDRTHFHLLLNGAYNAEEVALADQRFAMLTKIFQGIHEEEAFVGATVADAFAEISGLPAYRYPADSPNVRQVDHHPYLWARNLLANRLYDCPVIFMEPYVMNSTIDHARIQAGDYDGLREVAGETRPSIFREYADALTEGLLRHYSRHRISE